jgi:hypothetical protein
MHAALRRPVAGQVLAPWAPTPPAEPRRWRLVRETATAAYARLKTKLPAHERVIYIGLAAYFNRHQAWPTSRELFEFLTEQRLRKPKEARFRRIKDINNVSPRLSDMSTHGRTVVWRGEIRPCTSRRSRGRRMLTWRIPDRGER